MKHLILLLILSLFEPSTANAQATNDMPDTHKLGMALDYFAGGKYHEALMMFLKIDKKYKLNPRFKAYIGVCYYHEWEYEEACKYLDEAIPELDAFAKSERNVYYNVAAESHFELKEYDEAIPLYEKQLLVCHDNEKGDVFYRLGFCYMFKEKWQNAADYFRASLAYYERFPRPDVSSRISQLGAMINGCESQAKLR